MTLMEFLELLDMLRTARNGKGKMALRRIRHPVANVEKQALADIRSLGIDLKSSIRGALRKGLPAHLAVKTAFRKKNVPEKLQRLIVKHAESGIRKVPQPGH
jgi:hypothetical protein